MIVEWQWFQYVDSMGFNAILVFLWGHPSEYGLHHRRR